MGIAGGGGATPGTGPYTTTDPWGEPIARTKDGKVIAVGITKTQIIAAAGDVAVLVRVPDLNLIDYVLDINFYMEPVRDQHGIVNKKVSGNVVGFTLMGLEDGTTLTSEVIAIGPGN